MLSSVSRPRPGTVPSAYIGSLLRVSNITKRHGYLIDLENLGRKKQTGLST
jgi:hypothetical protein